MLVAEFQVAAADTGESHGARKLARKARTGLRILNNKLKAPSPRLPCALAPLALLHLFRADTLGGDSAYPLRLAAPPRSRPRALQ
jgi:hypothetical protein